MIFGLWTMNEVSKAAVIAWGLAGRPDRGASGSAESGSLGMREVARAGRPVGARRLAGSCAGGVADSAPEQVRVYGRVGRDGTSRQERMGGFYPEKKCCIFWAENNSGVFTTLEGSKTPECNNTVPLLPTTTPG